MARDLSNYDFGSAIRQAHNSDEGAIRVQSLGALVTEPFDAIEASYPDSVTEVYTYKTGGISGTVVAVVTVIYTSSSKDLVQSVERS